MVDDGDKGLRDKVRLKYASLQGVDETLAKRLEVSTFNAVLEKCISDATPRYWQNQVFRRRYAAKALSMHFNLANPNTPTLLSGLLDGSIPPSKLTRMTHYEMSPKIWAASFERVAKLQLRRQVAQENPDDITDNPGIQCGKCKSRKISFTQLQTRSADEPMTTFVYCHTCSNRFKF